MARAAAHVGDVARGARGAGVPRIARIVASVGAILAATAGAARADLPAITDRHYAIDLYDGVALGTARIVGMGGAAVAAAEGSAGTLVNPAAAAVRPATSTSWWGWDFHLDSQRALYASDLDNNGRLRGGGAGLTTFGLAGLMGPWAIAATATTQRTNVGDTGSGGALRADAVRGKFALARTFADEAITAGLGVRVGTLTIADDASGARLFEISGSGLDLGAVWRPPHGDLRAGAAVSLPINARKVAVASCDPSSCAGHILPEQVAVPWQIAIGVAWRRAPTAWNQWVGGTWRDERSLMVAADLVLTGWVPHGYGLEAFGEGKLQRSGANLDASVRAGVEYEVLPGHLRGRAGAYWEPGRFVGVGGRPHVTLGVEAGALQFRFWGRHRLRASVTADLAPRYGNAGVSVGFWH